MNLIELQRTLRRLRLGGMAAVLETRLHQAQVEPMAPIDLLATLVNDELTRRSDRLLEHRRKQANFRDPDKTLDNFDFQFNPKLNRSLVFDLATGGFITSEFRPAPAASTELAAKVSRLLEVDALSASRSRARSRGAQHANSCRP